MAAEVSVIGKLWMTTSKASSRRPSSVSTACCFVLVCRLAGRTKEHVLLLCFQRKSCCESEGWKMLEDSLAFGRNLLDLKRFFVT